MEGVNPDTRFNLDPDFPDYHPEQPGGLSKGGRSLETALFPYGELGEWKDRIHVSPYYPTYVPSDLKEYPFQVYEPAFREAFRAAEPGYFGTPAATSKDGTPATSTFTSPRADDASTRESRPFSCRRRRDSDGGCQTSGRETIA
jgi:hypothetical protein